MCTENSLSGAPPICVRFRPHHPVCVTLLSQQCMRADIACGSTCCDALEEHCNNGSCSEVWECQRVTSSRCPQCQGSACNTIGASCSRGGACGNYECMPNHQEHDLYAQRCVR